MNVKTRIRTRNSPLSAGTNAAPVALPPLTNCAIGGIAVDYMDLDQLILPQRRLRRHSKKQLGLISASIQAFGFNNPVMINDENVIVVGVGRALAAPIAGLTRVPVVRLSHLSSEELRSYALAENRLAELSDWDEDVLALELKDLSELSLSLEFEDIGFETAFSDRLIESVSGGFVFDGGRSSRAHAEAEARAAQVANDQDGGPVHGDRHDTNTVNEDEVVDVATDVPPRPQTDRPVVSRRGDVWQIGAHKLVCGDARSAADYARLFDDGCQAQMIFSDPPYNAAIDGNVCGLGSVTHDEFAMASGEMSQPDFADFLSTSFALMAEYSVSGSVHFLCMDWRHMTEMLEAGNANYTELKNLIVWNKGVGGMGTFYRSQHELIFAWKSGTDPHINNFRLGETGRYRTNVWTYPGMAGASGDRRELLALHPTVKPLAMVADAIKDCSRRGDIVLDPFCGSGTTILAAEQTGRVARCIEYEPKYVDVAIGRWERLTGQRAKLVETGLDFETVAAQRAGEREAA